MTQEKGPPASPVSLENVRDTGIVIPSLTAVPHA